MLTTLQFVKRRGSHLRVSVLLFTVCECRGTFPREPLLQNGMTALSSAAAFGRVEVLRALLAAGANPTALFQVSGGTRCRRPVFLSHFGCSDVSCSLCSRLVGPLCTGR